MAAPSNTAGEDHLIDVRNLTKTLSMQDGEITALRYVDVQLNRGEFVALIGKLGSGKSALLEILAGIERPTRGRVIVNGVSLPDLSEAGVADWRLQNLGMISPGGALDSGKTLLENVLLPMTRIARLSESDQRQRAQMLLELLQLSDKADCLPRQLSNDQQQFAAIACALANDPPLILADEPTAGMDPEMAEQVIALLEGLAAEGKTVLIATRDNSLARRVGCTLVMDNGEIVSEYLVRALHPLEPERLIELKQKYPPLNYAPRTPIVQQGELGDSFFIIVEGEVDVFLERPADEPLLVNRLGPGSYFGEMAILLQDVRSATIRVAEDRRASLIEIKAPDLNNLLEESPELRHTFEAILEQRRIGLNLQALAELKPELFNGISEDEQIRVCDPGEVIIRQGQIGKTFFILIEGTLEVVVERGDQQVLLATLQPGQVFGEQALMGARRRNATVRVAGDKAAQVVEFQAEDLRRLVNRSPAFRKSLREIVDSRTTTATMKREDLDLPKG